MKRVILAVAITATLIVTVIVAQAATLNVNAGVLQAQSVEFDFAPSTVAITVQLRVFNNGGQPVSGRAAPSTSVSVPTGATYSIAWDGSLTQFACGTTQLGLYPGYLDAGGGPFTATTATGHLVCLRQSGNTDPSINDVSVTFS